MSEVRILRNGDVRYRVAYNDAAGRHSSRVFRTAEAAAAFEAAVPRAIRRWPLRPLVEACRIDWDDFEKDKATRRDFTEMYGIYPRLIGPAMGSGLSDVDADRWALAAGLFPVEVWGLEWDEAGLALAEMDTEDAA